ncbi:MAG TPA: carboxypeptidase-like regulatory domain-containing protein [Terriglobales bacterium]|nr:carboxypeptidase-like regulatory domain-containing protein [Terriglobales bacterium]
MNIQTPSPTLHAQLLQKLDCIQMTLVAFVPAARDNASMRWPMAILFACFLCTTSARAVRELVVIEEPEAAQRVEGIVLDPTGAPIADMTVTDRTDDCKTVLRTTTTGSKGHFHFSKQRGKTVYCLRFDHTLWNPLQIKLRLDKHAPQREITARPEIGG